MLGVKSLINISAKKILERLNLFSSCSVGIVGDLMLDTFTYGRVERMSPEAPVPVVLIESEKQMLGGAGNVARNVKLLGGDVHIYGRVGNDAEGVKIIHLLTSEKIQSDGVFEESPNYSTIEKRRIIVADKHQMRIDKEVISNLDTENETLLLKKIESDIAHLDILMICDYAKGFITQPNAKKILELAHKNNIPIVVDTKPQRQSWFSNVSLITPNESEVTIMTKEDNIISAGNKLSEQTKSPVLVTRGKDGMTLFEQNRNEHFPAIETDIIDVSGAGDTVIACCALSIASGCNLQESAYIANRAASIAVSKRGTAAVHYDDLVKMFS